MNTQQIIGLVLLGLGSAPLVFCLVMICRTLYKYGEYGLLAILFFTPLTILGLALLIGPPL